jgi:exosortase C (VPDSG-CTERM-specific)
VTGAWWKWSRCEAGLFASVQPAPLSILARSQRDRQYLPYRYLKACEPQSTRTSREELVTSTCVPAPGTANGPRVKAFLIFGLLLTGAFALPLWRLIRYAAATEIHSHILLIPFISAYLWRTSCAGRSVAARPSIIAGIIVATVGAAALAGFWICTQTGKLLLNYGLTLSTLSFLSFLLAGALLTLGWPVLREKVFAIAFLAFAIPLPSAAIESLSIFLQHASAEAADVMLRLTGIPVLRTGLAFQFANISMYVAEECSGVRSTLVLFITSLLAGQLFLRSGWKKALLACAIFPIGILRNGFRIATLGWLSVNVDAGILDSPLHHRGGPIFFVLSLVPLCVLLWMLRRSDFRAAHPKS